MTKHLFPCFFLGGRDLEMVEIASLLADVGLSAVTVDERLAWGARASVYEAAILAALDRGDTPVLVELADDLPASIDRSRLIIVDHHGTRSGADRPTSLEQIYDLVGRQRGAVWTRWRALVAANDKGHAVALRAAGADADEIRAIRDADRAAQGVSAAIETESRRALAAATRVGGLLVVETSAPTSSAVADFLLPEYGGPGEGDTLVATTATYAFYGSGRVILQLSDMTGSWYGGDLPVRGFWGAPRALADFADLASRIAGLLAVPPTAVPTPPGR